MKIEFAEFLISALIAAESLLVSAFGSLYSVYGAYMTTGAAPICAVLRWLCLLLTLVVVVSALLAVYATYQVQLASPRIPRLVLVGLYLIVLLIPVPAGVITWRMYKDAAP